MDIQFLLKRTLTLGNETTEISSGLPQGSCLSPTLFNIYTSQLHEINDTQTQLFQFADDLAIISTNPNKAKAAQNLQNKIEELQVKCQMFNLEFNLEKTKFMHMSANKNKISTYKSTEPILNKFSISNG